MRLITRALLIFLFVSIFVPRAVRAQSGNYIADAVEALRSSPVYVAPGTEGTDYDTEAKLKKFLGPEDNIVLVMLPTEALNGTEVVSIARQISEGLGNEKIIGLSVGRAVVGYSSILPEGVANDKMQRAVNVSNDPVTALITFAQNIHSYQAENPQPTPPPTPRPTPKPIELPKASEVGTPVWVFLGVLLLVVLVILFLFVKKNAKRIWRKRSFKPLDEQIDLIVPMVHEIADGRVRKELQKACDVAYGLVDILESSQVHLGYVEEKFPVLLSNMSRQINALLSDQRGNRPLASDKMREIKRLLLTYDDLFVALQKNDPDAVKLLESIFDSGNMMISTLGYYEEE